MNENDKTATTGETEKVYTLKVDGSVDSDAGAAAEYECKGNKDASTSIVIGGQTIDSAWSKGDKVSYTYDYQTGKVTINVPPKAAGTKG